MASPRRPAGSEGELARGGEQKNVCTIKIIKNADIYGPAQAAQLQQGETSRSSETESTGRCFFLAAYFLSCSSHSGISVHISNDFSIITFHCESNEHASIHSFIRLHLTSPLRSHLVSCSKCSWPSNLTNKDCTLAANSL